MRRIEEFETVKEAELNSSSAFAAWKKNLLAEVESYKDSIVWHMIVDPQAHDELPEYLSRNEDGFYAWPLFLNTYNDELIASAPQMVRLEYGSTFCGWALDILETVPLGILVGSKPGAEHALYQHLQSLVEYQDPYGRTMIFRICDPRLLYGLKTYHDQRAKDYILNGSLFFEAWEPGRAKSVFLEPSCDEPMNFSEGYVLSDELMEHLFNEARIHSIIGGLGDEPGEILRDMPLPEAYGLVEDSWALVREYGYDEGDMAVCAAYTALMGIEVWEKEDLKAAMRARESGDHLGMALEQIEN